MLLKTLNLWTALSSSSLFTERLCRLGSRHHPRANYTPSCCLSKPDTEYTQVESTKCTVEQCHFYAMKWLSNSKNIVFVEFLLDSEQFTLRQFGWTISLQMEHSISMRLNFSSSSSTVSSFPASPQMRHTAVWGRTGYKITEAGQSGCCLNNISLLVNIQLCLSQRLYGELVLGLWI